jgi:glycosyltransferase involved in cell wall biosynthesis
MSIARNLKSVFPTGTRTLLKSKYPELIESLAIGLDTIPIAMDVRRWPRLLRPKPLHHPLNAKMWSGFGRKAAEGLEVLKQAAHGRRRLVAAAAWPLARWHAYNENYAGALDNLILMTTASPKLRRNAYVQLLTVECLLQLGRPHEAQRWLRWALRGVKQAQTESYLTTANVHAALVTGPLNTKSADNERLILLNKAYENAGFSKIEKKDPNAPLTLDNITASNPRPVDASTKLSVLMPAYNCAETLPIAVMSILNQTWHNLELIIVDDKSPDGTWEVIEKFATLDSRIIPLRHEQNGGAYAARNTALAHATGEFVTVHDADDWSHPEKFAAQMLYALSTPNGLSTTVGVRVSYDLRFKVNPSHAGMIMQNTSSLLLKRQMLADLGGWDRTRIAADSELYERVKVKHNLATNKLFPTAPLTFILFSGTSLTQTKAAGIDTVNYGARRQYKEAYRFWHASEMAKAEPDLRMSAERRFPAPRIVLGRKEPIQDIDAVFVANFADALRPFEQNIEQWESLASAGLKLGLIHWPTYLSTEANIATPVRSAINTGLIENIVPGESVSCRAAILLDPQLLADPPSPLPTVSAQRLYVTGGATLSVDEETTAKGYFGCNPLILGEGGLSPALEWLQSNSQEL